MKKICFLVFIISFSTALHAQPWAQPGATWYYDINPNGGGVTGYVKITKTGDTLIQSHWCDILEKRSVGHTYPMFQYFNAVYGYEYTYTQGNIVYNWRNNSFFVLYDFNALPGDGWTVTASHMGIVTQCADSGSVSVTQTGSINISGQNLQTLSVVSDSGSLYGFCEMPGPSMIIERIGNTCSFIADFVAPWCVADANEMFGLRCYSDSSGFFYNTGLVTNCDDITGINENISAAKFNISPNPASTEFQISIPIAIGINFQKDDEIIFSDITGKICFTKKIQSLTSDLRLQISDLNNGIYFLEIKTKKGVLNKKVVVQH